MKHASPSIITCSFDEDTELWKLTPLKLLKPAEPEYHYDIEGDLLEILRQASRTAGQKQG